MCREKEDETSTAPIVFALFFHLAMKYQLKKMDGKNGLARTADVKSNGTMDGLPTDYWDNFRFGHLSAYVNLYFTLHLQLNEVAYITQA